MCAPKGDLMRSQHGLRQRFCFCPPQRRNCTILVNRPISRPTTAEQRHIPPFRSFVLCKNVTFDPGVPRVGFQSMSTARSLSGENLIPSHFTSSLHRLRDHSVRCRLWHDTWNKAHCYCELQGARAPNSVGWMAARYLFTAPNVTLRVAFRLECAGAHVKFTPAPIDRTWGVLCCDKPFQSICDGVWFRLL